MNTYLVTIVIGKKAFRHMERGYNSGQAKAMIMARYSGVDAIYAEIRLRGFAVVKWL